MTYINDNTYATDLNDHSSNAAFTAQGATIRHIETWHDENETIIVWDIPPISEDELPF